MKFIVALLLSLVPSVLAAQSTQRCGNSTGITIEVVSSNDSVARARSLTANNPIDTTWVFQVAQKTWPLGHMEAAIKADWANEQRTNRVCSGVNLSMDNAILTVKGARGTIHFKASLADLNQ
jgi:hypothetical protein